jgi:hypothetical protein
LRLAHQVSLLFELRYVLQRCFAMSLPEHS